MNERRQIKVTSASNVYNKRNSEKTTENAKTNTNTVMKKEKEKRGCRRESREEIE